MNPKKVILTSLAGMSLFGAALSACAPKPVRGEEVQGLDDEAMSTGLDKRDLQKMLHDNVARFYKLTSAA